MEVQTVPIAPDVEYFLDCAAEEFSLSSGAHLTLRLYGDRGTLMRICDDEHRVPARRLSWRYGKCEQFATYAHDIMMSAPPNLRNALLCVELHSNAYQLKEAVPILAGWNFEDSTTGGCLENFLPRYRCDAKYRPFRRLDRHLRSPRAIRKYVKRNENFDHYLPRIQRLRAISVWPDQEAHIPINDLLDEQRDKIRETRRQAMRNLMVDVNAARLGPSSKPKAERKMLRRSAAIATNLIGAAAVAAFIHGQVVDIAGDKMLFKVACAGTLTAAGHGALSVQVADKDTKHVLSGLCIYFDNTPVLDQLAAIALHVQAGNEMALFETGNVFAMTPEGAAHSLYEKRAHKAAHNRDTSRWELQRIAREAYEKDVLPLYTDALAVKLWGRDAKRIKEWLA